MKKNVVTFLLSIAGVLTLCSPLFAAAEQSDSGGSFLLALFIGFFALIVVFQLVPACLMFFGMVRGLAGGKGSEQQKSAVNR